MALGEKRSLGFPTKLDTNWHVQSQKAGSLKFPKEQKEGMFCLCIENKDADVLYSYCTPDIHLCLRMCKMPAFTCCK